MRVAEGSLRSRRRYVLARKKKIRRRAAFLKKPAPTTQATEATNQSLISSVAQLTSSFALRASSWHAEATPLLATLPGLTKPPLFPYPFRRMPRIPLLTFEKVCHLQANTCTSSTTRSIEREFCLSLDCTVSMKFIAFSDSGTAEYFSGSETLGGRL